MSASVNDYFLKARQNFSTTIGAGGVAGASTATIPLSDVTNLPTDTAIELVINRVDSSGVETNNYETTRGIVSGSNLTSCVRGVEGTAQSWDAGTVVELLHTASVQNRMVTGLLVEHDQTGAHKAMTFNSGFVSNSATYFQSAVTHNGASYFQQTAIFNSGLNSVSGSAIFNSAIWVAGNKVDGSSSAPTSITIAAAPDDVNASGIKIALTANVASAFGDVGYISSTGTVVLAKADAIANCNGLVMCCDTTIAQTASGNWLLHGTARNDAWNWTVGGMIYVSTTGTTGNTLTQTAPSGANNVIQVLGYATHADRMLFNPSPVQVEHT